MLPKEELAAIRKATGNFYDRPPSHWAKAFWEGEPAAAPGISPADRVVMRWLYRSSAYDPKRDAFTFLTSYRGAARILELDRDTVSAAVKRLEALGVIETNRHKNRVLIRVFHIKESGGNWDVF